MISLLAAVAISANAYTYSIPNDGQYPDAQQTPGAANPALTKDVICSSGFRTGDYRHTTKGQKDRAYRRKSVPPVLRSRGEVDHLISLELGGSNDDANLWWQPYSNLGSVSSSPCVSQNLGGREKDQVEGALHSEVCSEEISLERAQDIVAHSWVECYRTILRGEVCR